MKRFCALFVILLTFSYWFNVASAQNAVKIVRIPDANLAAQLRKALGLGPTALITKQALAELTTLDASRDSKEELDFPISDLTGLEHATQLEELRLWQHREIRDISPLAGLTKLRKLGLGDNVIRDISPLTGLTELRELHLGGNQIRDISPLAGLTQLWNLALYRNQIRDISPLAGLTQLSTLHLAENQISDISPLAGLIQLRDLGFLGLGENQISDISPLVGLIQLEKLDLVNNQIRDVTPLVGLVNLRKLALAGNPVRDASPLANLTRLVEVDIEIPNQVRTGGVIPDRHLAGAVRAALRLPNTKPITKQKMRGLKILIVAHNDQVSSLVGLEHATQLEMLIFNRSQISGDISVIANLTRLNHLHLGYSQISDISPLANLTQLTNLNLQGNDISDISVLTNLTQLESLWLVYNRIRDISSVAGLTQLKRLGLYSNEIRNVLPLTKLVDLEVLSLGNNPIEDASPLAKLPKLRDVDIEIPQPQPPIHPPIYWIDRASGRLHYHIGTQVEYLVSGIQHATGLAVDTRARKIYWTEQTGRDVGKVKRANLNGSNVRTLARLRSVPSGIAVDSVEKKLYWANSRGRIQRANLNGQQIRTLIKNLDYPSNIALDVAGGKLYWTERSRHIRCANLDGSDVQDVASSLGRLGSIAVFEGRLYWTEQTSKKRGKIRRANLKSLNVRTLATLQSVPISIAVDSGGRRLYWTNSRGKIQRANLNARSIQTLVTGLETPNRIALGIAIPLAHRPKPAAPISVESPPDETVLFSNYPNPFNPETWIPYQLSESAEVTLHIYAVDGTLIQKLALGHQPAGVYHSKSRAAYWNGRNIIGELVASGVYFYTLTAGDFTATRKMFIRK